MPIIKKPVTVDITFEFSHKKAIYKSPITGTLVAIEIKKVVIKIENNYPQTETKSCTCIITSTKEAYYNLNELIFE